MARLKRALNFWEALAINIGAIIGAGIFVISGLAAGIAGPAVVVSISIGAIMAVLTGLSFAALAHTYIKEGGSYEYSKRALGNYAGVLTGLIWIIGSTVAGAAMALSFGSYFISAFPIGLSPAMLAIVLIVLLGIVNYFGVRDSADLSVALTIIKILVLVLFVLVGLFFINWSNYRPFVPSGLTGILSGAAFIFFAYTGFARITVLGEEVKNPRRTIPRVVLASIAISCAIYLLVMFVLLGIVNYKSLATSSSPLSQAMLAATKSPQLGFVIALGAIFATMNVALTMILGLSRIVFSMARDKQLPRPFSKISRFGTPAYAILASSAVMVATILLISFKEIVAMSNSLVLVSYAISNLAAFALLRKNERAIRGTIYSSRPFVAVPILGAAFSIVLLFFLTYISIAVTALLLVLVSVYYLLLNRGRQNNPRPA